MPFDPWMGTGPPLIVLAAIAIAIVGPEDWLPGAVAMALFVTQLAIAGAIWTRRLGFPATVAFMATFLILVMLASAYQWYFGYSSCESATLGFLSSPALPSSVPRA